MDAEQVERVVKTGKPEKFYPLCVEGQCQEFGEWEVWRQGWQETKINACPLHLATIAKRWSGFVARHIEKT